MGAEPRDLGDEVLDDVSEDPESGTHPEHVGFTQACQGTGGVLAVGVSAATCVCCRADPAREGDVGADERSEGQVGETCRRVGSEIDAERGQHRDAGDGEGEVAADRGAEEAACDGDHEAEKVAGSCRIEHRCSSRFVGSVGVGFVGTDGGHLGAGGGLGIEGVPEPFAHQPTGQLEADHALTQS